MFVKENLVTMIKNLVIMIKFGDMIKFSYFMINRDSLTASQNFLIEKNS